MTKPVIHVASTEPSRVELAQINLWYAGAHAVTHKTLEGFLNALRGDNNASGLYIGVPGHGISGPSELESLIPQFKGVDGQIRLVIDRSDKEFLEQQGWGDRIHTYEGNGLVIAIRLASRSILDIETAA